jgi:hypothetical protein
MYFMEIIHNINLELGRFDNPPRLSFMQKDSARTIHAKLYQNNIPWVPSGDFETYFAFNRPKNGPVVLTTVSRDDSIIPIVEVVEDGIIINITYEITAFAGEFPAVIGFVSSSGEQIATFPIFISVIENPAASAEDAEPIEPSLFDALMSAIALERSRINNLATLKEGSTTGDAELQDIRVAEDSTVYGSAGEAVREQIAGVKNRIRPIENELKDARTDANDLEYDTIGDAIREQIKMVDDKANQVIIEIDNARFGADGTEYATLGDAIREQIQNIGTGGGGGETPSTAVLFTKQSLTEKQQAQARENIGVESYINQQLGVIENGSY